MGFGSVLFYLMAATAVAAALLMVTRRNPVHSALWMIVTFFAMAVIYLLLNAHFIAVAQVMVYAGAVMMLILFVIMLVRLEQGGKAEEGHPGRSRSAKMAWIILAVVLLTEILAGALAYRMTGRVGAYPAEVVAKAGNVKTVGSLLYGKYLFPFEVASILLLVGIVGAVVIARRRR